MKLSSFDPAALKNKQRRLKRKCYLLFVLPAVIGFLAVKVLQVYLSMILRKAGTQTSSACQAEQEPAAGSSETPSLTVFGAARPKETVIPKPVKKTVFKPQVLTPEPVSQPVKKSSP